MEAMQDKLNYIRLLQNRFEKNEKAYTDSSYNEASVRKDFLNEFLELLDWDVYNKGGARRGFEKVKVEDKALIDGGIKHTDYTLYRGGSPIIIIEAKKPSVNIKDSVDPALQARCYAYSLKAPLAIVTNFREFALYDAKKKINKKDSSATSRLEYFTYKELDTKFEHLHSVISYSAVDNGLLNEWLGTDKGKSGTLAVDDDFLAMIEKWRYEIAKDISCHNTIEDEEALTAFVQKLIDRIVFLRIAEGRNIEVPFTLQKCANVESGVYDALQKVFNKANEKYNSGLFAKDKNQREFTVSDSVLSSVLLQIYYPDCPYEFSVLPIEILGSIYERFLGKVVRFSRKTKEGRSIKIEEKSEVAKAGGVFYTPQYIVQFIIENTIGLAIKGKSPEEISHLHFLDPACGSGSFLVAAFSYLLDYHLDYYTQECRVKESLKNETIFEVQDGVSKSIFQLSLKVKKQILLNNIYGVDIDAQAVEVTKLSLFIKLLDDESALKGELFKRSDTEQQKLLPNIDSNICSGNSLIGDDFWESAERNLFDNRDYFNSVKCFNWQKAFPKVFKEGGFDCVIGNPPYLRVQGLHENHEEETKFIQKNFEVAKGRYDFYILFLERGFKLLKENGTLSFILPHKFINGSFGRATRAFIAKNKALKYLVHFGAFQVFDRASVYTCIIGLQRGQKSFNFAKVNPLTIKDAVKFQEILEDKVTQDAWAFGCQEEDSLLEKLREQKLLLRDMVQYCSQGTVSMGDDIYLLKGKVQENYFVGYSTSMQKEVKLEAAIMKPLLKGEDIKRWQTPTNTYWEIYPHHKVANKTVPYEEKELKSSFPLTYEYLKQYKKLLVTKKIKYKTNPKYWYALHRAREITMFEQEKILIASISLGCNMTYDTSGIYHNSGNYTLILKEEYKANTLAYLAIFNSKVMWYFLSHTGTTLRGGYFCFTTNYMYPFPVPKLQDKEAKALSDMASHLILLYKNGTDSITKKQAAFIEGQIDSLVCKLYGLSEEEANKVQESLQ